VNATGSRVVSVHGILIQERNHRLACICIRIMMTIMKL
jgi:hypothetical protein